MSCRAKGNNPQQQIASCGMLVLGCQASRDTLKQGEFRGLPVVLVHQGLVAHVQGAHELQGPNLHGKSLIRPTKPIFFLL